MRWAALLQRVFAIDALSCPRCGATLRLIAAIEDPAVAAPIRSIAYPLRSGSSEPSCCQAWAGQETRTVKLPTTSGTSRAIVNVIVVTLIFGTSSAIADENPVNDYARNGVYFGMGILGGAYTQAENSDEKLLKELGYMVDVDYRVAGGIDVWAGYRFHPRLAAQVRYQELSKSKISVEDLAVLKVNSWAVTADLKGYFLTGRLQPYALLGFGYLKARVTDSLDLGISESQGAFATRVGGGIEFYVRNDTVLGIELAGVIPDKQLKDRDVLTLGLGFDYRF